MLANILFANSSTHKLSHSSIRRRETTRSTSKAKESDSELPGKDDKEEVHDDDLDVEEDVTFADDDDEDEEVTMPEEDVLKNVDQLVTEDESEAPGEDTSIELVTEDETTEVVKESVVEPKGSNDDVPTTTEVKSVAKDVVAVKNDKESVIEDDKANGNDDDEDDKDSKASSIKKPITDESSSSYKRSYSSIRPREHIKLMCVHCEIPIRTFNVS